MPLGAVRAMPAFCELSAAVQAKVGFPNKNKKLRNTAYKKAAAANAAAATKCYY